MKSIPETKAEMAAMIRDQVAVAQSLVPQLTGLYLVCLKPASGETPLHYQNNEGSIKWTPIAMAKRYGSCGAARIALRRFDAKATPEGYKLAVVEGGALLAQHIAQLEALALSWEAA